MLGAIAGICPLPAPAEKPDYAELAGRWAPDLYQDTWFMPEGDYLTAFNADGDWVGRNNLDNFQAGKFKPYRAVVYYSVIESATHYFIFYCFFHPVDYDAYYMRLIPTTCHENDLEGILLVVAKSPSERFGRFRVMESLAHGFFNGYANGDGIRPNQIKGFEPARLRDGSHPEIYLEGGGHGPYELHSRKSGFKNEEFKGRTGVVYRHTGVAQSPSGPDDRNLGYALVDVLEPGGIWDHRGDGETFNLKKRLAYQAPAGRPGMPGAVSGCDAPAGTVPLAFYGDLSGFANGKDRANPFWAWGLKLPPGEPKGAWGFDPAWTMSRHYRFDEPFSLDYLNNFYLGIKQP